MQQLLEEDPDKAASALSDTLTEVLATSAFVLTEPTDAPASWNDYLLEGQLAFDGAAAGHLVLGLPVSLARELAANLLGVDMDEPDIEGQARDAVGEILNIVGGNLTPCLYGPDAVCRYEVPMVELVSPAKHQRHLDGAKAYVTMVTDTGANIDLALL